MHDVLLERSGAVGLAEFPDAVSAQRAGVDTHVVDAAEPLLAVVAVVLGTA
jgi:hypothetical protein